MKIALQSIKSKKGLIIIGLLIFVAIDVAGVFLIGNAVKDHFSDTSEDIPVSLSDLWSSSFDPEKSSRILDAEVNTFQAEKYALERNYKKAHEAFLDAEAGFSDVFGAKSGFVSLIQTRRGQCEFDFRHYDEAAIAFRSSLIGSLTKDGKKGKSYFLSNKWLGYALEYQSKYPEAIKVFLENVDIAKNLDQADRSKSNKRTLEALARLKDCCVYGGQYDKAIDVSKEILANAKQLDVQERSKQLTHTLRAMNSLASCYVSAKQYDKAIEIEGERVSIARGLPDNKKILVLCLLELGNVRPIQSNEAQAKLAVGDFSDALNIDPASARAYSYRASAYNFLKDYPHEIDDLTAAIKLRESVNKNPNRKGEYGGELWWDHHSLGKVFLKMGRNQDAVDEFSACFDVEKRFGMPGSPYVYVERGDVYRKLKQYDSAISDYGHRLDEFKTLRRAWSIEELEECAQVHEKRASAYTALGQPELAAADQLKAKELAVQLKTARLKSKSDKESKSGEDSESGEDRESAEQSD